MENLKSYHHLHFIGIGGIGMSAIASVLLERGFRVSGSDLSENAVTQRLTRQGATIFKGHRAENIAGADLVVYSSAVRPENPERRTAEESGIATWRRARVLSEIMRGGKSIAVSGTHGKTTTTSMVSLALLEGGMDPTLVIGGELDALSGNARNGRGEWVVAEADESDASFLDMNPDRIIVTNIEADHMDFYRNMDHLIGTFGDFLGRLRPGGKAIACADSPTVMKLVREMSVSALTYSVDNPEADMTPREIRHLSKSGGIRFTAQFKGQSLGTVRLKIPGRQNVANALAAILTALDVGCPFEAATRALAGYAGAKRRFQVKGTSNGITIIDDYAHHPTEIKATLSAARSALGSKRGRRIVGVFQPHRYSRTASLAPEFGRAFREADLIVVTDVYAAGEDPIEGVNGSSIYNQVVADGHPQVYYVPTTMDVAAFLKPRLASGDMLFTLGAGDVWRLGETILEDLRRSETPPPRDFDPTFQPVAA